MCVRISLSLYVPIQISIHNLLDNKLRKSKGKSALNNFNFSH